MKLDSAGTISAPLSLTAMLRDKWVQEREAIAVAMTKRRSAGAPPDDDEGAYHARQAILAIDDDVKRRTALASFDAMRSTLAIEDPGEYQPNADYDGITLRIRKVAAKVRTAAQVALGDAFEGADQAQAVANVRGAQRAFVVVAVAEIRGISIGDDEIGERVEGALDALEDNGSILADIFRAAMAFNALSGEKKSSFGAQVESTSVTRTLTATDAQTATAPPRAATTTARSNGRDLMASDTVHARAESYAPNPGSAESGSYMPHYPIAGD
jgi:hypothetical protein